ncbi:MAG: hypothetical protein RR346_09495 [Bacteroidales bacterium]
MIKKELVFSPELVAGLFKTLRRQYNVFLISLIAFTLLFSTKIIFLNQVTAEAAIQLQSFSVLLTLGIIPFSLWFFGKRVNRISDNESWECKQKSYIKNSAIRISLLWLVVALNIAFYFLTLSYSILLCAGMGVTASLFCIPSLKKIQNDLFPAEEEEEDLPTENEEEE